MSSFVASTGQVGTKQSKNNRGDWGWQEAVSAVTPLNEACALLQALSGCGQASWER